MDNVDALLVHIEHSKPIEVSEFVTSLNAIGNLFSSFAQKHGETKEMSNSKLYVEKIEEGCIDIILTEVITPCLIPFAENMNILFEFSSYVKNVLDYFISGTGKKPNLDVQECRNFKDMLTVTAGDNNGTTTIGAIYKNSKDKIFNNCTFNFQSSNSSQNQLEKVIGELMETGKANEIQKRQLMYIYQLRSDMNTNAWNKAIIDSISNKRIPVVFETDELKERILHSDENPTKKGFLVDVIVQTINGKIASYKVMELHDVIDLNID